MTAPKTVCVPVTFQADLGARAREVAECRARINDLRHALTCEEARLAQAERVWRNTDAEAEPMLFDFTRKLKPTAPKFVEPAEADGSELPPLPEKISTPAEFFMAWKTQFDHDFEYDNHDRAEDVQRLFGILYRTLGDAQAYDRACTAILKALDNRIGGWGLSRPKPGSANYCLAILFDLIQTEGLVSEAIYDAAGIN